MALKISLAGRQLTLLPGTTLSLEIHSALFAEDVFRGVFSYSISLPLDDNNRQSFGYPEVIENRADLRRAFPDCEAEWEGYQLGRGGELRIQRVRPATVEVMLLFGLSQVARELADRKLASFALGGTRSVAPLVEVEGVNIPGLVVHALATVQQPEQYDYVFAPFVNYAYWPEPVEGVPVAPPPVVNAWAFTAQPILGNAAGGTFTYYVPFSVMGIPPVVSSGQNPGMTPLPKLAFVLRSVLAELGLRVERDELVGELARLVVLNGYSASYEFSLANCMPDLSPKELLLKLRTTIGLVPDADGQGRVSLLLLQNVLNSTEYDDWSEQAAGELDEREVPEPTGCTLTYTLPAGDQRTATYYQAPADLPLGAPVATRSELPNSGPITDIATNELRLVENEDSYYRSNVQVAYEFGVFVYNWTRSGSRFRPVDVAGGGEELPQGATAVALEYVDALPGQNTVYTQRALFPTFTRPAFDSSRPPDERGTDLQLVFYRGRQPYVISANHPDAALQPDYPLLTPLNKDANGAVIGQQSLQIDGPTGTAETLVGDWLSLVATATPLRWRVWLTPEQLANPRLHIRKRIAGNEYLVRKINVVLPMVKPAIVELMPLKTS